MTDPCIARTAGEVGAHVGAALRCLHHIDIPAARTMIDETVAFVGIVDPDLATASEANVAYNRAILDAVETFVATIEQLVQPNGRPT